MPGNARPVEEAHTVREAELPPYVSHGTPNAYTNYGCRCDFCSEAHALYRSERRARDPVKYTTYMREYMRKYRARKRAEAEGKTSDDQGGGLRGENNRAPDSALPDPKPRGPE
jgi:hypothetical protein